MPGRRRALAPSPGTGLSQPTSTHRFLEGAIDAVLRRSRPDEPEGASPGSRGTAGFGRPAAARRGPNVALVGPESPSTLKVTPELACRIPPSRPIGQALKWELQDQEGEVKSQQF